ncbi:MAG TPA: hypothetical protein VJR89_19935 [Polyangiales bacterium]|nr:hypothetical protein [Polyangiales bacterium]
MFGEIGHVIIRASAVLSTIAALAAFTSCGDDDTSEPQDNEADAAADSGAKPRTPAEEIKALVTGLIADYDLDLKANCGCYVQMGAYKSVDECIMWSASNDTWVPCASAVLIENDSPEVRAAFDCLHKQQRDSAACLKDRPCDASVRAECDQSPIQCVGDQLPVFLELGRRCPDISLLPRLQ